VRSLLDAHDGIAVVAEAATGVEAITEARAKQPDVAVLDLHMPGVDGVEATRRIVATSPHLSVLILTMFDDDDSVFAAMRAGAPATYSRAPTSSTFCTRCRRWGGVRRSSGPTVAQRIIEFFAAPRSAPLSSAFPELTERELEVLDHIAAGHSNADISAHLALSPKTVRNHVSNIFTKLQVADRAQAIVRARDGGLGR